MFVGFFVILITSPDLITQFSSQVALTGCNNQNQTPVSSLQDLTAWVQSIPKNRDPLLLAYTSVVHFPNCVATLQSVDWTKERDTRENVKQNDKNKTTIFPQIKLCTSVKQSYMEKNKSYKL